MTEFTYTISADGSCAGNPGPGGWAFILFVGRPRALGEIERGSGCAPMGSTNEMELMAIVAGLRAIAAKPLTGPADAFIRLRMDSDYVLDGLFERRATWKARGWKNASKKPIANQALWIELDALVTRLTAAGYTLTQDYAKESDGDSLLSALLWEVYLQATLKEAC